MRLSLWHGSAVLVSFLGLTFNGKLTGPAWAVMDAAPAPSSPLSPAPQVQTIPFSPAALSEIPAPAVTRLDIPVTWQLTKTRLMGPGATTITESFKETWTLEMRPGGILFLKSPRATVPAYVGGAEGSSPVPPAVVVAERDFARLVGVSTGTSAESEEGEPGAGLARPITINLSRTRNAEITMTWSEDEHYAVNLNVGNTTLF